MLRSAWAFVSRRFVADSSKNRLAFNAPFLIAQSGQLVLTIFTSIRGQPLIIKIIER